MFLLTRVVRFAVAPAGHAPSERGPNGYAGNPPLRGLGAHYELVVSCAGDVPPNVGYLINIKEIDQAVRAHIVPLIQSEFESGGAREPSELMPRIMNSLGPPLGGLLKSCRWRLSPYYSIEMSTAAMSTVILRQKFDFCAAHRLHVASLSHDENRRLFGKCNNPGGHGHNYQFEPCVAVPLDGAGRHAFHMPQLERIADDTIIQRFDHKNLNSDTDEFRDGSGLNPSVENIAKVCFELLEGAIKKSGASAQLKSMTVWESDRTSCTYPA